MASISFGYEVCFGHRLMNHKGKCRFPHGHSYFFEVEPRGPVDPDTGMIMDFSVLKDIVRRFFEPFDHAFVLFELDPFVGTLREESMDVPTPVPTKVVVLNTHPTAENLAQLLRNYMHEEHRLYTKVTCWEQRDCSATADTQATHRVDIVEAW
jgi:6-pyruvoyltetrahydropterin/6-carboxytetrahydropterin synthase